MYWLCTVTGNYYCNIQWAALSFYLYGFHFHILPTTRMKGIPERGRIIHYQHSNQDEHLKKLPN